MYGTCRAHIPTVPGLNQRVHGPPSYAHQTGSMAYYQTRGPVLPTAVTLWRTLSAPQLSYSRHSHPGHFFAAVEHVLGSWQTEKLRKREGGTLPGLASAMRERDSNEHLESLICSGVLPAIPRPASTHSPCWCGSLFVRKSGELARSSCGAFRPRALFASRAAVALAGAALRRSERMMAACIPVEPVPH
eukprot:365811-Chlamydomonas_euryale.AAC.17